MVIGSFSIMAAEMSKSPSGISENCERRAPSFVSLPNFLRISRISPAICRHWLSSDPNSSTRPTRSASSASCSRRSSSSSSLRKERNRMFKIASACTSEIEKVTINCCLGSSSKRIMRITSSRLRKATRKPARISRRWSIFFRRYSERRTNT